MAKDVVVIPSERIVSRIYLVRGERVMLDSDLAELYDIGTKVLNQAVSRNMQRFPDEFMFRLTEDETRSLRSQIVTSNKGRGGRRYAPRVFTEQGVAMLSSVLKSDRAIQVNILIIKTFVRMRRLLETNQVLREKLAAMERQLGTHSQIIQEIYDLLMHHLDEPQSPKEKLGFDTGEIK
jgi:hypothetical protein